ncbi:MAG: efflux RND transporter permease subunit, partial [Acidobacteria bacterium]|nr:efflux RND transporter permease subunit [Acidobacteriota bacterium]
MSDFQPEIKGPLQWLLAFCLRFPLVVFLTYGLLIGWGLMVAPFQWNWSWLEQDPVPVDAIPDIGENQQIVFTEWMGRSPQDIEDQVTYPLTSALLGVPGVKTVRSNSFFGFSTIYVIFKEDVEFYWSRSRLLEKLASLPDGTLPNGVSPMLGPDSNALAQVFWYTLEGRDPQGNPVGGWDLHELRSIQDWKVRYELLAADGVAEVSSIGGFVQEYQIDVNPDAMRAHQVTLEQVFNAVRQSNLDVGARNLEINQVEYFIRALGYVKDLSDLENAVVKTNQNVPIYVKDVAHVHLGPAQRRGILDKGGAEVVGGVVAARYGANPQAVITEIKDRIAKLSVGLPQRTLADGTVSKVTIVPFYDRSGLIAETLGTLKTALSHEILITILVVLVMLVDFRSSLLISMLLPIAVLLTLIAMKGFQVDANVVALSGIAIAIGTMVDVGIVIMENIVKHLESNPRNVRLAVFDASSEVGSAVITAVATTVLSFLPIFSMEGAEGKLFKPLAYTKTFALMASILIALTLIPPLAVVFFRLSKKPRLWLEGLWLALAIALFFVHWGLGIGFLIWRTLKWVRLPTKVQTYLPWVLNGLCAILVAGVLTTHWYPLTPQKGFVLNFIFVVVILGGILLFFQ